MRFHQIPRPLVQLIAAMLLPTALAAPADEAAFNLNQLFARDCAGGVVCGYYGQLCCSAGSVCYTDSQQRASCTAEIVAAAATTSGGGYWQYYTTTIVQTDLETRTTVMSTYIAGGAASATPTGSCDWAQGETPCGPRCCASNQYCFNANSGTCSAAAGGGSSGFYSGSGSATAGPPVRPTTSGTVVITATVSPATTVPFMTPVATGSNVTITSDEMNNGSGGLSGGDIAGIVIGVLAGIILLSLLCFYCCLYGLLDSLLACCGCGGLGGGRKRTTEIDEYEHYSHHGGGSRAVGSATVGRTWYGARKPTTRVERVEKRESQSGGNGWFGIAACLAACFAFLGLKRDFDRNRRERREKEYSEYSYSSDYYTSASSASSDDRDRRPNPSRYSSRR